MFEPLTRPERRGAHGRSARSSARRSCGPRSAAARSRVAGARTPSLSMALASAGTSVQALRNLAQPFVDLLGMKPAGEQLARPPVAAVRREHGGDEVAGAGRAGESLVARAVRMRQRVALGVDPPGRRARGVGAAGEARPPPPAPRRSSRPRPARPRPGRGSCRTRCRRGEMPRRAARRSSCPACRRSAVAPTWTASSACPGPPRHATGLEPEMRCTKRLGSSPSGPMRPLVSTRTPRSGGSRSPSAASAVGSP